MIIMFCHALKYDYEGTIPLSTAYLPDIMHLVLCDIKALTIDNRLHLLASAKGWMLSELADLSFSLLERTLSPMVYRHLTFESTV